MIISPCISICKSDPTTGLCYGCGRNDDEKRKWKDEKSGQDKYSTEVVIQGYNSSLTMLGGGNSSSLSNQDSTQSIENTSQASQNDLDDEIPF